MKPAIDCINYLIGQAIKNVLLKKVFEPLSLQFLAQAERSVPR